MPASEAQRGQGGAKLLSVVFWIGICLAPLAAVLVMMSDGATGLRVASVLAILSVVLIGLSIMLRPDATRVRVEVEEMMFEELDVLRADVREDISTAARATHRAFSEKLQQLYETVEALREQVESARAEGFQVGAARTKSAPPPPARPASSPSVGTAMVGGGVVRHTETVQVTTRSTIVDPHADGNQGKVYGAPPGTVYGARPADHSAGPSAPRRPVDPVEDHSADWAPREESWTEQRLRERTAEARDTGRDASSRDESAGRRSRHAEGRSDDVGDDPRWTGMRSGDRWASVRTDDRGRELRMGERRSAVHSDESGTELRIEDRWAQVRREDAQVRREDARHRGERWEPDQMNFGDDSGSWSETNWERRGGDDAPALPASPAEPASTWTQGWSDEREREPARRRRGEDRDDRWERDDTTGRGAARPRRPEFELTDERWR